MTTKSLGQQAYERDLARRGTYDDGSPRPMWSNLSEIARSSWDRNPTDRFPQNEPTRRVLKSGRIVNRQPEMVVLSIKTRSPWKWIAIDMETGETWCGSDSNTCWKRAPAGVVAGMQTVLTQTGTDPSAIARLSPTLEGGEKSGELAELKIRTYYPGKWAAIDMDSGEVWLGSPSERHWQASTQDVLLELRAMLENAGKVTLPKEASHRPPAPRPGYKR